LVSRGVIATDSEEVMKATACFGAEAILTSEACRSGTERIASIVNQLEADLIINVQGDEPLIDPGLIDHLIESWIDHPCDVITAARRITDPMLLEESKVVKVVRAVDGRALYFSRSAVPHVRDKDRVDWLNYGTFWQHIGIYGYAREFLENFHNLPESPIEKMEKLEQLRFLEAGINVRVIETDYLPHPVDTKEDLDLVREIFKEKNL
jgi:3-deoxy-manno-octulosonate cytidylyltransferase (CMP-KDO synthetase)